MVRAMRRIAWQETEHDTAQENAIRLKPIKIGGGGGNPGVKIDPE